MRVPAFYRKGSPPLSGVQYSAASLASTIRAKWWQATGAAVRCWVDADGFVCSDLFNGLPAAASNPTPTQQVKEETI